MSVDDVLMDLWVKDPHEVPYPEAIATTKTELYQMMLGVIGDDEPLLAADPMQKRSLEIRRNELRAEQRAALKQAFGMEGVE